MSKKLSNSIAALLLLFMLVVAVLSMQDESAIMDEVAHIPAGYSYLTQRDMRLNPEHPPLLKDLSAVPLLFIKDINFPDQLDSWQNKVNGQWDFGFNFLYNSNNDADKVIFWSRTSMLLILLLLGIYIFRWTKELFGSKTGLFALFLFAFSPTFIAHGRYVTTDVGAAVAFFVATYYFVKWLQSTNFQFSIFNFQLLLAGVSFGIAQLIKFSLVLLIPIFGLLLLIWIFIRWRELKRNLFKLIVSYGAKFIIILVIGYLVVYPVYLFHTSNYPIERQISDTDFISSQFPIKPVNKVLVWMVKKPILRPYAQYLLGLFMVFQRATGGNTTFFLGDVTNKGWHHYFPIVYIIKTPLALHIFTIIALLFIAWFSFGKATEDKQRFIRWLKKYFVELTALIFLAVYWGFSIKSNLNIGVRHVLPTFPFIYILISGQIKRILDYTKKAKPNSKASLALSVLFAVLILWYALSSLLVFPYYLTHFNELAGGAKNGHIYVTDSNLDWGQDLKRLAKWVDEFTPPAGTAFAGQSIEKIHVDYFGGATVEYYLGDKFEPWWGSRNPEEARGSWLAVSATFLQQGRAIPTKGWSQPTDYYLWLNQYEPVTVIGNSIFVYYIN